MGGITRTFERSSGASGATSRVDGMGFVLRPTTLLVAAGAKGGNSRPVATPAELVLFGLAFAAMGLFWAIVMPRLPSGTVAQRVLVPRGSLRFKLILSWIFVAVGLLLVIDGCASMT
jgi:hypothetical protein